MQRNLRALIIGAVIALTGSSHGRAAYDNPEILTVEDAFGNAVQTFTLEQLKTAFPQQTYNTRTPWTKDAETVIFRGPLLKDVLSRAGISENLNIKVIAYDDFVSEIHGDEIQQYEPILAIERNCTDDDDTQGLCKGAQGFRLIPMLEKGPIFVVWPFDRLPAAYVPGRNSIWVFFPVALRPAR